MQLQPEPPADAACADDDPERVIAQARMDALLRYAQARLAGNRLPSRKELEPLEERLDISISTMYRQIYSAVKVGCKVTWKDFKRRRSHGGRGKFRLNDVKQQELRQAIDHVYFDLKLRPGQKGITSAIRAHIIKRGKLPVAEIPKPKTISKWTKHYADRYDGLLKQKRLSAQRPLGPVMDSIAMDWTDRNIKSAESLFVFTDKDEKIGVANLICGIEEVTLLPWGWLWCVGSPAPDLLPECVFRGTLTKRSLSARYNLTHRASVAGKPRALSFAANRKPPDSLVARFAASGIGISTEIRAVSNPRIDAIANSLYGRFLAYLREKSDIASDIKKLSYQHRETASGHLCIHWSNLEREWVTWCFNHYIIQENDRLEGEAPATRFDVAVKPTTLPPEYGAALIDRPENKYYYLKEEKRVFNQHGIEISNRFYSTEILRRTFDYARRSSRTKHSVWTSHIDLTEVYVRNPENQAFIIAVPIRRPKPSELLGCTEWEWAIRWSNSRGPNNPTEALSDAGEIASESPITDMGAPPSPSNPPAGAAVAVGEPARSPTPVPTKPGPLKISLSTSNGPTAPASDPTPTTSPAHPPRVPIHLPEMRKRRNRF